MVDHANCNQVESFLKALNRALEDLETKFHYYYFLTIDVNSPQINCLLELENRALAVLSPEDSIISNLNDLKILINNLKAYQHYTPRSFIHRRLISKQIFRVGLLIQKEIQLCFDRENISFLIQILLQESCHDEEKLRALDQFEGRVSSGFDLELQNLILKVSLFQVFESILCDDSCSSVVREKAGSVIAASARFNRSVFAGSLLMGFTIPALLLMASSKSLEVLISLVKSIKGHLVDEMELNGHIPKIIGLLSSEDVHVRLMAMHCLLEMAYFGKKEVIESMVDCGLVEKLVLLQRVEPECELSDEVGQVEEINNRELCVDDELGRETGESSSNGSFSGCIARFAIQVEVGEGMEKIEKKEMKMEILTRARAACVSEAEAATIVADILWGSHP